MRENRHLVLASLGRCQVMSFTEVTDALTAADGAKFEHFSVAGVSLGGMTAAELARSHADRVRKRALICTSARMDRAPLQGCFHRQRTARIGRIGRLFGASVNLISGKPKLAVRSFLKAHCLAARTTKPGREARPDKAWLCDATTIATSWKSEPLPTQ